MDLSPKDKKHLVYLEKGYQRELKFERFYLPIEGDVAFVNKNSTLYQAPLNEPDRTPFSPFLGKWNLPLFKRD
jgi:hypothetical protein